VVRPDPVQRAGQRRAVSQGELQSHASSRQAAQGVAQVEPAGHLALASGHLAAPTRPRDGQQGSHRDQQLAPAGLLQQQPVPTDIEQAAPYRAGALADQAQLATRRRAQAVLKPEQPGLPARPIADLAREFGRGHRIGLRLEVGE